MLLLKTNTYQDCQIVRTRTEEILKSLDIVVDVGDVYDSMQNKFDHHQLSFKDTWATGQFKGPGMKYDKIKLSASGLVFKHFGKEVITNCMKNNYNKSMISQEIEYIWHKLYRNLFQEIDALDNGTDVADDMLYEYCSNLNFRVCNVNIPWNCRPRYSGVTPS